MRYEKFKNLQTLNEEVVEKQEIKLDVYENEVETRDGLNETTDISTMDSPNIQFQFDKYTQPIGKSLIRRL